MLTTLKFLRFPECQALLDSVMENCRFSDYRAKTLKCNCRDKSNVQIVMYFVIYYAALGEIDGCG